MKRGFTLLETMFCFFLVMFVLMVLFELFPSSMLATRRTECQLHAQSVADEALESARAGGFAALTVGAPRPISPQTLDGVDYTGTLEVRSDSTVSSDFVKVLRVTVQWSYHGQASRIVREVAVNNVRS